MLVTATIPQPVHRAVGGPANEPNIFLSFNQDVKSMVNSSVDGTVCWKMESDVSGTAVMSRTSASVSGYRGFDMFEYIAVRNIMSESVFEYMALDMSSWTCVVGGSMVRYRT